MTRFALWLFFLADIAGVLWAVRVLAREARRHLSWYRARHRYCAESPTLELPEDFVLIPAQVGAPLRLVS